MVGWLLRVILRVLQNWLYRSLSMLLTASLLFVCNTYFQHPFFSFKNEECYFVTLAVVHELMPLVQASDITPYHIIMNVVSIILNQIYSILSCFTSDDSSMTIILCTLKANTVVTCGFSYSNRVQQMVRTGRQKMRCCVVLYLLFYFSRRRREHLEEDTLLRSELFDGCQILQSIVFPATKNAHTCVCFIGILTYFPVKQLVTHVTFIYFLKKGGRAFHESI